MSALDFSLHTFMMKYRTGQRVILTPWLTIDDKPSHVQEKPITATVRVVNCDQAFGVYFITDTDKLYGTAMEMADIDCPHCVEMNRVSVMELNHRNLKNFTPSRLFTELEWDTNALHADSMIAKQSGDEALAKKLNLLMNDHFRRLAETYRDVANFEVDITKLGAPWPYAVKFS